MFEFYSRLSPEKKRRYDLMLDTHYVLLMCDLALFQETDENNQASLSASWIYSIQNTIEKFGFKTSSYPHGSISANRFYYEALRNYLQMTFTSELEYKYISKAIVNFLRLRRDDSDISKSNLFGSFYSLTNSHTRENNLVRKVSFNIRHSVTALWILCEESSNIDNEYFIESFKSINNCVDDFIRIDRVWNGDEFEHLTLSSTINTCNSILQKSNNAQIKSLADNLKTKCESVFFEKCLDQNMLGDYYLKLPVNKPMSKFEFYLTYFSLTQVKDLLSDKRIQSVLVNILKNKVESKDGVGLPLHNLEKYAGKEQIIPDFGTSASMVYLLHHILKNHIGDESWINICKTNFNQLLDFCLNVFDKQEYYHLSISENNAKILMLPNYNNRIQHIKDLNDDVKLIKQILNEETICANGNFNKNLKNVSFKNNLEHIKDILYTWNISSNSEPNKYFNNNDVVIKAGEFVGALMIGAVKAAV